MKTLAEIHSSLSKLLTHQTIKEIAWDKNRDMPIFTMSNGDVVSIYMYVSTTDYDLSVSYTHNGQRTGGYIGYDDNFASKDLSIESGIVVSDVSIIQDCIDVEIQEVALSGSGQRAVLFLVLSSRKQLQYSTSFNNPDFSLILLDL